MIEHCGNCDVGYYSKFDNVCSCPCYTAGKTKYKHCCAWKQRKKKEFERRVYVCSPFSGDTAGNMEKAKKYARKVLEAGAIPFVPHLLYPQFLDEDSKEERSLGITCGLAFLDACDELWVFGETESSGMRAEIEYARKAKKPIIYVSDKEAESECLNLF